MERIQNASLIRPSHRLFREPVNGLTHAAGAVLSIAGSAFLMGQASAAGKETHVLAFSVFGVSLILLYAASALYHLVPGGEKAIATLRRIDHMMIFVLIAGTYTPICLIALRGSWGRNMLPFIWILAAAGIIFTLFWMTAPRWLSTTLYVLMGWTAVIAIVPLVHALSAEGLTWLFGGGAFYTFGAAIYGMRKPDPFPGRFGFHEIWHLFVMAGSFCHYMVMVTSILPMP